MDGYHVGLFAVPASQVADLVELCKQPEYENTLETAVRYNRVYRRASEVATARCEITGWDASMASACVSDALLRPLPWPRDQTVYAPEQCAPLERGIAEIVRHAGGPNKWMARLAKKKNTVPPDRLAQVFEAARDVLRTACRQGAGFVWVERDDAAEARYIAWRKRIEEKAAEPPLPPEEIAEIRARFDALKERGDLMTEAEQSASSENLGAAWLCVVSDDVARDYVAAIAAAGAWDSDEEEDDADDYDVEDDADDYDAEDSYEDSADDEDDDDYDSDDDVEPDPYTLANLNVYQHAIKHAELRKHNEVTTIDGIDELLPTIAPEIHQPSGAYTAAQAAQLLPAVLHWETENGGEAATVELLLDRVFGYKTHVRRAYRAFKRILTAAVKTERAFVWFTSDAFRVLRGLSRLS